MEAAVTLRQLQFVPAIVTVAPCGCGTGGTNISIGFGSPKEPVQAGERVEGSITIRFSDSLDSWTGRKVRVSVQAPADVTVEPAVTEVVLDDDGRGTVKIYITPSKEAEAGVRKLKTAADGGKQSTMLEIDVSVRR